MQYDILLALFNFCGFNSQMRCRISVFIFVSGFALGRPQNFPAFCDIFDIFFIIALLH